MPCLHCLGPTPFRSTHCTSELHALGPKTTMSPFCRRGSAVGGAWAGRTFLLALRSPNITQVGIWVRVLGRLRAERFDLGLKLLAVLTCDVTFVRCPSRQGERCDSVRSARCLGQADCPTLVGAAESHCLHRSFEIGPPHTGAW